MTRGLLAVAFVALAVTCCGGSSGSASAADTMPVGKWTEGPLREDGDAVASAIDAATDGFQGGTFVPAGCQRLAEVTSRASDKPRPDDQVLAAVWTSALSQGLEAAGACSENDGERFLAAIEGFSGEIGKARERIAAL